MIPTIVFPDGTHLSEPSNEELADKLGLERTALPHVYDLVVVGGGAAGLASSIYAARENMQTLVIDRKGLRSQAGWPSARTTTRGSPTGSAASCSSASILASAVGEGAAAAIAIRRWLETQEARSVHRM